MRVKKNPKIAFLTHPLRRMILAVFGAIICLVIWQLVSEHLVSEKSAFPSPIGVGTALLRMWHSGELAEDVVASLKRIVVGFVIAFVAAIVIGIIAVRYSKLYDSVRSVMDLLSSIPPIAWTPLAILWFGIGNAPAYFIVFLGAFFPMFASIYAGITRVDRDLIDAARTLGASRTFVVWNVTFPASIPHIITGIRTGIGVAWFNVIAAELIGVRSGLGYKIQLSRTLLFSEQVVAVMLVIGVLGYFMTRTVGSLGNLVAPWAIQDDSKQRWVRRRNKLSRLCKLAARVLRVLTHTENLLARQAMTSTEASSNVNQPPSHIAETETVLISVDGVSKAFGDPEEEGRIQALDNVSFKVRQGESFCVLGPNGSGKTTLIRIIAGLLVPDTGTVLFEGREVTTPSTKRTVVFQNFALFPWRTSRGNIALALEAKHCEYGRYAETQEAKSNMISRSLIQADLENFGNMYPAELSGGMKQKLALARALAVRPKAILMDEPFASLDPIVREHSQESILRMLSDQEATIILVTHNLDEAIFMSDRILILSNRPGKVKAIVDVDLPYPRLVDVRTQPKFQDLRAKLWEILRSDSAVVSTPNKSSDKPLEI